MSTTANGAANRPGATRRRHAFLPWLRSIPVRTWVALVIVIVALVFVLQNRQYTSIYLFTVSVSAPLWTILLITLAVGILAGLLVRRRRRDRTRSR
jgi:uncharacterized integral membrane protein